MGEAGFVIELSRIGIDRSVNNWLKVVVARGKRSVCLLGAIRLELTIQPHQGGPGGTWLAEILTSSEREWIISITRGSNHMPRVTGNVQMLRGERR